MSPRNYHLRLQDISESLSRISEYTKDLDQEQWKNDRKTIDAVIRNLEVIGEAVSHLPETFKAAQKHIPWQQIRGIRNILIHEYFGVDEEIIWQTIQNDLPSLKAEIDKLIK